ncbi:hypothetical protein JTE90_001031, partial [Oedothorax gibbosus]
GVTIQRLANSASKDRKTRHRRIKKQRRYERWSHSHFYPLVTLLNLLHKTRKVKRIDGPFRSPFHRNQDKASFSPFAHARFSSLAAFGDSAFPFDRVRPSQKTPPNLSSGGRAYKGHALGG